MSYDTSIPGFPEIAEWPCAPVRPVRMVDHGAYRDPGPRCTYFVDLEDGAGHRHSFFFDRFPGRLCYGAMDDADDAAFLKPGIPIEREAFALIESLATDSPDAEDLRRCLEHAKTWSRLPGHEPSGSESR
jgi:hypothetical protein